MTEEAFQEAVLDRLDALTALLSLAHGDAIGRTREQLRSDPLSAAVLDAAGEEWISAGDLQAAVKTATGRSPATIRRRVSELSSSGVLRSRGATNTRAYRSRGIV